MQKLNLEVYQSQRRGGMGKTAASVKDEDFVEQLIVANTLELSYVFQT